MLAALLTLFGFQCWKLFYKDPVWVTEAHSSLAFCKGSLFCLQLSEKSISTAHLDKLIYIRWALLDVFVSILSTIPTYDCAPGGILQKSLSQGDSHAVVLTSVTGNNVMRREGRAEMFGTNVWNSNNINHSQLPMSARVSLCAGICVSVTQLLHLPGINPRTANQMQCWGGKRNAQWKWFLYPLLVKECLGKFIQCAQGLLCNNFLSWGDKKQLFITKLFVRFFRFIYKVANLVC